MFLFTDTKVGRFAFQWKYVSDILNIFAIFLIYINEMIYLCAYKSNK